MASRNVPPVEAHPFGPAVGRLVEQFSSLPGIGRKTAERLANHILSVPESEALQLAAAIREVKESVHRCRQCANLTDQELCTICNDPRRDQTVVCIVEQPRDVTALEASGVFHGTYHVLGGNISPLEGVGPDDLTIGQLMERVRKNGVKEVVMATNPTLDGDGTSLFIANLLQEFPVTITRLARGIPTGSVLEFANKEMLADALQGRQAF
ncbi:MAG: recombination protein RecR [Planctomycetota bacterium]|nr:MAG: recombination protein RecR [Planctomycetota bacterium]REJ95717.1 MAG: recombination protein RecR [Planctomycetota bacterium]REK23411.1 MAG: recombination protein RecR [Planctomycetota bacterium]REK38952.1 MAG: recombination protein RecR [Planctomycetota bacterium]